MSLRVGVVSDTHVPLYARAVPDSLWKAFEGCDHILHAGDFDTWAVYEEFKKRFPTSAVIGNRDEFRVCEEIPEQRVVELGGFKIGMTHGFGPSGRLDERVVKAWSEGPVDLLVFGHSHVPAVVEVEGTRLLNPGSPTDTISADRQTYAILEIDETIEIFIHELES